MSITVRLVQAQTWLQQAQLWLQGRMLQPCLDVAHGLWVTMQAEAEFVLLQTASSTCQGTSRAEVFDTTSRRLQDSAIQAAGLPCRDRVQTMGLMDKAPRNMSRIRYSGYNLWVFTRCLV
jgi:hypothetical protein